jgi:hypothetical protein
LDTAAEIFRHYFNDIAGFGTWTDAHVGSSILSLATIQVSKLHGHTTRSIGDVSMGFGLAGACARPKPFQPT